MWLANDIVLAGTSGWVIDEDRGVLGGARLVDGSWEPWSPPCSQSPSDAALAASDASRLVAICYEGLESSSPPVVHLYVSNDGGATFQPVTTTPPSFPQSTSAIASPAPGVVILGNTGDLMGTFDGGETWSVVRQQPNSAVWLQVGFTSPSQGLAIEDGSLLMTFDGGHDWAPVDFSTTQG